MLSPISLTVAHALRLVDDKSCNDKSDEECEAPFYSGSKFKSWTTVWVKRQVSQLYDSIFYPIICV